MRKPLRWIVTSVFVLTVLVAYLVRHKAVDGPNLISIATKVTNVQDGVSYWWLSSNQLLVKTTTNNTQNSRAWSGYFELIDTNRHTRTKLTGLTSAITRYVSGYYANGPWGFHLSPDGKRLVWARSGPRSHGLFPVTALLDGSDYCEWNALPGDLRSWIDADRFVAIFKRNQTMYAVVHDATHHAVDRVLVYSSPEAQALLKQAGLGDDLANESADSVGPVLRATRIKGGTDFQIETRRAQAPPGTPVEPTDSVSFRSGTNVFDYAPNSQMTRIMFQVIDPQVPAYAALVHRLCPSYDFPERPIDRIFIYRPDKEVMYELGRVDETSSGTPELQAMWLPDGKHLQFWYKNAVYVVDVE
jgi:hypothetical protein